MQDEATKAEALRPPAKERAKLEQLWIEEAERRFQAYKNGQVQGIPAEQALHDARSKIPQNP